MKKGKYLITGCAGFIGSHLVKKISDKYDLILIDDLSKEQNDPIDIIEKYTTYPSESDFKKISQFCNKIFKGNTVEEIVENLKNENYDL